MVNPERRATIEDIANHWWVNWSYKSSVCDCDSLKDSESPLLARFIDWHHRSSGRLLETEGKSKCLSKPAAPDAALERQRSLKKSKKGNDIAQSLHGEGDENVSKSISKRPKSILKKRSSSEHRSHSTGLIEGVSITSALPSSFTTEKDLCRTGVSVISTLEVQIPVRHSTKLSTPMPKKGILKKTQQRESGYYSSPERSESSELLNNNDETDSSDASPKTVEAPRSLSHSLSYRGKGILKHNGKYTTCSIDSTLVGQAEQNPKSMEDVAMSREGLSHIISDDSVLSSDSLDMPGSRPARQRIRTCVSAENILQMHDFEGLKKYNRPQNLKRYRSRLVDSSFSLLTDMDNVTQVYKKALEICNKIN